jgi:spore maturation protein CgeB
MRVFFASNLSANATGLNASLAWYYNLYRPLVDLGHDVVPFEYDLNPVFRNLDPSVPEQKAFIETNRPRVEEELLRQVKATHERRPIDLFFSYFYSACVRPEVILEIRTMGIRTANWYCNGAHQFHLVEEIAPAYDYCLVPEKFRLEDYRRIGARPIYCQEAANPAVYRPYHLPKEFDVTFVGQAYGDRPAYIGYLLARGIDARVWGFGWRNYSPEARAARTGRLRRMVRTLREKVFPRPVEGGDAGGFGPVKELPSSILGGILSDDDMIRMYSRSRINLGFSSCGNTHEGAKRILQVRLRDFEVPMSGGFYMVEYMEELEEFFDIGREIVCYTSPSDLAEKIEYYLRHESEREAIATAGFERCRRDHTWQRRFQAAFREMGLP